MGRLPASLAWALPPVDPPDVHPLRHRRPKRPLAWGESAVQRHRRSRRGDKIRTDSAVKLYREHTHPKRAALDRKAKDARRGAPPPVRTDRRRTYRYPVSPARLSRQMKVVGFHLTNEAGRGRYGPSLVILSPVDAKSFRVVAVPRSFLVPI